MLKDSDPQPQRPDDTKWAFFFVSLRVQEILWQIFFFFQQPVKDPEVNLS